MTAIYRLSEASQRLNITGAELITVASELEAPLYVRPTAELDYRECLYSSMSRPPHKPSLPRNSPHYILDVRLPLPPMVFLEVAPHSYEGLAAMESVIVESFPRCAILCDDGTLKLREPTWTDEELQLFTRPVLPRLLYHCAIEAFPKGMNAVSRELICQRQHTSIDLHQLWLSAQSLEEISNHLSANDSLTTSPLMQLEWMSKDLITLHHAAQKLEDYRRAGVVIDSQIQTDVLVWIGQRMKLKADAEHVGEAWKIISPSDEVDSCFSARIETLSPIYPYEPHISAKLTWVTEFSRRLHEDYQKSGTNNRKSFFATKVIKSSLKEEGITGKAARAIASFITPDDVKRQRVR